MNPYSSHYNKIFIIIVMNPVVNFLPQMASNLPLSSSVYSIHLHSTLKSLAFILSAAGAVRFVLAFSLFYLGIFSLEVALSLYGLLPAFLLLPFGWSDLTNRILLAVWFYSSLSLDLFAGHLLFTVLLTFLLSIFILSYTTNRPMTTLIALVAHLVIGATFFSIYTSMHSVSTAEGTIAFSLHSELGADLCICGVRIVGLILWIAYTHTRLSLQVANIETGKATLEKELQLKKTFYRDAVKNIGNSIQTLVLPLELMLAENIEEEQKEGQATCELNTELCKVSKLSGKKVQIQVANVMDLRKVHSKTLALHNKPDNIKERVHDLYELFLILADERKLQFNLEMDINIPDYLLCDGMRVEQVLTNYLVAVFEATRKGEVVVNMKWKEDYPIDLKRGLENLRSSPDLTTTCSRQISKGENVPHSSLEGIFFL